MPKANPLKQRAEIFAALADETRLSIVDALADGEMRSIAELTEGGVITRQAVTKHLKVLEHVGLVQYEKSGRETLYRLNAKPMETARTYLDIVSKQWDQALYRLKLFVEDDE